MAHNTQVPPRLPTGITLKLRQGGEHGTEGFVMLFLSRVGKHKKIITIRCGLVDVNDEGNSTYTVMNPTAKTITLRKNTVIGVFQPVTGEWKLLEWSKDSILGKEQVEEEAEEDQFENC